MSERIPNAASCAIFSGDQVLLIQRAFAPYKGYWTFPGGRLEDGETPQECVRREIREELALDIGPVAPVTLSDGGGGFWLQVFATRMQTGTPRPSHEIADWCWCKLEEISGYETTPDLELIASKAFDTLTQL